MACLATTWLRQQLQQDLQGSWQGKLPCPTDAVSADACTYPGLSRRHTFLLHHAPHSSNLLHRSRPGKEQHRCKGIWVSEPAVEGTHTLPLCPPPKTP